MLNIDAPGSNLETPMETQLLVHVRPSKEGHQNLNQKLEKKPTQHDGGCTVGQRGLGHVSWACPEDMLGREDTCVLRCPKCVLLS